MTTPPSDLSADTYRRLSPLALIAFLLGLLSVLAFASKWLLAIPLFAVLLAVVALLAIRARADQYSGSRLALAGAALALFCTTAAVVRTQLANYWWQAQAQETTQAWLQKIAEGDYSRSLELLTPQAFMLFSPINSPDAEANSSQQRFELALANLRQDPLYQRFAPAAHNKAQQPTFDLQYLETQVAPHRSKGKTTMAYVYRVHPQENDSFVLTVRLFSTPASVDTTMPLRIDNWRVVDPDSSN